jgi:beta-lactamase regulating signal transducer with metallopeptidase domain
MVIKDVRLQRRFDRYLQSIDFVDRPELLEIAAEYGNDFAVLISPQLHMPFTGGILHPVIYLPDVELSDAEWRMVFRHEITHIRSRDNLKKLFFLVVEALFWWNPLAHFSSVEINALIELRCDAKVTDKLDKREYLAYIELLKHLLDTASTEEVTSVVSSLISNNAEIRLRFEVLGDDHSEHRFTRHVFTCIACLLLIASYFLLVQPARFDGSEYISESDIDYNVSYVHTDSSFSEDIYLLLKDGQYYLCSHDGIIGSVQEEFLTEPPFNTLPIIGG